MKKLTQREEDILSYLVRGYTNKQMARALNLSAHTVRDHVSSMLVKLGANNRVDLAVTGLKRMDSAPAHLDHDRVNRAEISHNS